MVDSPSPNDEKGFILYFLRFNIMFTKKWGLSPFSFLPTLNQNPINNLAKENRWA